MVFNCDCMLFKSRNKANLYQIQNFTLFSQWESHQSLSENRGSQSESNEDPIKAYQKTEVLNQNPMKIPSEPRYKKREDLSKPYRSLGEELGFSIYYCKADPPKKRKSKLGGTPLTIVDATLYYIILYYVILYYVILYYIMLYYIILYYNIYIYYIPVFVV